MKLVVFYKNYSQFIFLIYLIIKSEISKGIYLNEK